MGTAEQTRKRLEHTPFDSAKKLELAEEKIQREEWERVTRARKRKQLLNKPENSIVLETFRQGIGHKFHDDGHNTFCQLHINDDGKQVIAITSELENDENKLVLAGHLVRATSSALHANYLKAFGILGETETSQEASRTDSEN